MNEKIKKYAPWVFSAILVGLLITLALVLRFQKPEVVTVEKVKIEYQEKIVYVKVADTEKKEDEHKKENQVITEEKKTVKRPDGTTETTESKKTENQAETIRTVVEVKKVIEYVDREKIVIQEKEIKTTPVQKDWRLGLKAGTSVTGLKIQPSAPYIDPIILHIDGERRIISLGKVDLYGGLWVQTSSFKTLELGLGLSVVF